MAPRTLHRHTQQENRRIMPKTPKTAFTEDDLIRWSEIAIDQTPDTPSIGHCLTCPQVSSYAMKTHPLGVTIRVKLDNGQTTTFTFNPVIAREMVKTLESAGEKGRWMNDKRNITFPIVKE
jgi:hypothetical protein